MKNNGLLTLYMLKADKQTIDFFNENYFTATGDVKPHNVTFAFPENKKEVFQVAMHQVNDDCLRFTIQFENDDENAIDDAVYIKHTLVKHFPDAKEVFANISPSPLPGRGNNLIVK